MPVDEDPGPPTATEHPSPVFPDKFDQRPPEELHPGGHRENPPPWAQNERTWDSCAQQWQDTPLAKWARCAGQVMVWDTPYINRHIHGDWGDVDHEDWKRNDASIEEGSRIISACQTAVGHIWIITEADRAVTTVLLPREY